MKKLLCLSVCLGLTAFSSAFAAPATGNCQTVAQKAADAIGSMNADQPEVHAVVALQGAPGTSETYADPQGYFSIQTQMDMMGENMCNVISVKYNWTTN